jgi:hypothetical protein
VLTLLCKATGHALRSHDFVKPQDMPDTVFDSLSQTHILYSGSKGLPLFKTANTM